MSIIYKTYKDCFVLEKSKLDRLVSVVRERFPEPVNENYEVRHEDRTVTHESSLERVYQLHNSGRKIVKHFEVVLREPGDYSSALAPSSETNPRLEIFFSDTLDGDRMGCFVRGPDAQWASDSFSVIEEQLERCMKKGLMYNTGSSSVFRLLSLFFGVSFLLAILLINSFSERDLPTHYWLTRSDIDELVSPLNKNSAMSQDEFLAIVKRQLKNVDDSYRETPFKLSWPILTLVAPLLLVIGSFIYLIMRCYPIAVFVWGDREEWYKNLLKRRSIIWNTIIASTAISIISGLFIMGLESVLK